MELKKNEEVNQQPQQSQYGGAQQPPYQQTYQQSQPQQSPYGGGVPYQQAQQQMPPYGGGSPYGGGVPYPQDPSPVQYGNTTRASKSSFNPWIVIIPLLILVGIIAVSQFKRIFGKAEYIPGTLDGKVFTNEFFGFKLDLSKGNWDVEGFSGSAESEKNQLDSKQPVTELRATNSASREAFSFDVAQTMYNIKETSTDFTKLVEDYKEEYQRQLEAQGFEIEEIKQEKMTILGKTCDGYLITAKYSQGAQSTKLNAAQFFMIKDNYICAFSGASTSEGKAKLIITNNVKPN
ncbi:MAG: hypothetical protein IKS48_08090 [Eubacterium sp.]|nr:hypothetical protein [Eubacterium sp.]